MQNKKMNFDEFTKYVAKEIINYLPETFSGASVQLDTVVKNNDQKLTGLSIREKGSNTCPTLYLELFFKAYDVAGVPMEAILNRIADLRIKYSVPNIDTEFVKDFSKARDRVIPRLINKDENAEHLAGRPYKTILDLAVTYNILLHVEGQVANIAVTNDLLEAWGTNTEELHELALHNMPKLLPSVFQGMSMKMNTLSKGQPPILAPSREIIFVLSNTEDWYGAAALLDETIMKKVVEQVGTAFYVLPSSVHEVILNP